MNGARISGIALGGSAWYHPQGVRWVVGGMLVSWLGHLALNGSHCARSRANVVSEKQIHRSQSRCQVKHALKHISVHAFVSVSTVLVLLSGGSCQSRWFHDGTPTGPQTMAHRSVLWTYYYWYNNYTGSIQQYLGEYNVCSFPLWIPGKKDSNMIARCCMGECNVELAVGEYWDPQVNSDNLEWLALRFVDWHCKCQTNGELMVVKDEWKVAAIEIRCQRYLWDQGDWPMMTSANDRNF